MSKKEKKKKIRRPSVPIVSDATLSNVASSGQARGIGGQRDFQPDYSYVKRDLRRIGVIAGSFVVILILLSFFLR